MGVDFSWNLQVVPSKFSGDALDVLTAQIEAKFADRVIANVGLCLCLHSYEKIGDPYVYPSDGAAHYKARNTQAVFLVICTTAVAVI